jgi:hypothetical protein
MDRNLMWVRAIKWWLKERDCMKAFVLAAASNPCLATAMEYMGTIQVMKSEKKANWLREHCTDKAKGLVILPVDLFEHADNHEEGKGKP